MTRGFAILLLCSWCACPVPWAMAELQSGGPYFEDGYLGLSQNALRTKVGTPHAVRDRKSALRVFRYYTYDDWEQYYKKLISPQYGEDVYNYKRNGVNIRYSFRYLADPNDPADYPTLYVYLVEVEFSPPVPLKLVPSVVPEFRPSTEPSAPAFRSNVWILLFEGEPSAEARAIVKERGKERFDWSLAFQLFSLEGLPDFLTVEEPIDRLEISAQSIQLVKKRQRLTHEPMLNPYSKEFTLLPPPPPPPTKTIPVPKYED
ncbi:MAG: hypothetical protein ACE5NA_06200 [Nitrospiraceae bacterium]